MRIKENRLEKFLKNYDDIVKGCKILVVDDSPDILLLLESILMTESFIPVTEKNPLRALEIIDSTFDAIILDLMMPEMDGITAVKEIMKTDSSAKIIMCSAMGQQAMVIDAIQAGAKDFIVKPFQPNRVLEAVQKVVGR